MRPLFIAIMGDRIQYVSQSTISIYIIYQFYSVSKALLLANNNKQKNKKYKKQYKKFFIN